MRAKGVPNAKPRRYAGAERVEELKAEVGRLKMKLPNLSKASKARVKMGITRKDVSKIKAAAARYLTTGDAGLEELEAVITHQTLVAILIEGVYGTELWRTDGLGAQGRVFAAGNRARFVDSATRLLKELREVREARGQKDHPLIDGKVDLDAVKPIRAWQQNLFKPGDENVARRQRGEEAGAAGAGEAADGADFAGGGEGEAAEGVGGGGDGPVGVADGE